jgi:MFS family permease
MKRRFLGAAEQTFGSLRVRNFRLFFVGQGVSQVGNWLTLVAQTLLVLKLGGNGISIGLLTACQFLPVLLFAAWAGLIADRSDKRKLLFIVQIFAMAQSFTMAALAFTGNPPLIAVYAVAMAGGFAMAFDNPARRSFVVEMVPQENVQNAVSLNSALMTSSRIIGPALAGLLITTVGFPWAFLLDGFSYIAVLVALGMMRKSELRPAPVTQRAKGQVRAGLRYVRRVPELWIPLVMMAIVGTLAFNFTVVFPLMVTQAFHSNTAMFTVLFSVTSIGSLIGALYSAHRRTIDVRDVAFASLFFGAAMLAFAAVPSLAWAFPVGLLVGAGSITFLTTSTAIVQLKAAPEMRGRVLALQAIVFLGSTPIGGPVVGYISDVFGPRAGVLIGGVAGCAAAAWGLWAYKRVRGSFAADVPLPEPADVIVPEPVA